MSKAKYRCTVPGCDRTGPYKLYCTKHYQQVKKYGEVQPDKQTFDVCQVDGCEKSPRSTVSRYCEMHYYRIHRNGTLATVAPRVPDAECIVDGCDAPAGYADGHCRNHRLGLDRNGDYLNHSTGPFNHMWKTDEEVTYFTIHQRVSRWRGPASAHECVDCGSTAAQWSYNHKDPEERFEPYMGYSIPYSIDTSFYEPRCVKCHKHFDLEEVKRRREETDAA